MGIRYILNKSIYFYPDDRKIESVASGRTCVLHTPAALCLTALLEHNGSILSQTELINIGWPSQSASYTTQASYYQCFVNLRKNFASIGFTEKLLITVPRRGIQMNPQIICECEVLDAPSFPLTVSAPTVVNESVAGLETGKEPFSGRYKKTVLSGAVLVLIPPIMFFGYGEEDFMEDYHTVAGTGECYHFQSPGTADTGNILNLLKAHGYNCTLGKHFYIHKRNDTPSLRFFVCDDVYKEDCYSVAILDKE